MKSLTTVIEVLESCQNDAIECFECPMHHETECEVKSVALAYLKEYQAEKGSLKNARALTEEAYEKHTRWIENCKKAYDKYKSLELGLIHAHADLLDNPPLTWDELRQMEGKPIWIELLKGSWKGWDVVGGFTDDDFGEAMVTVRLDDYYKVDLGKMWQAYRKERK